MGGGMNNLSVDNGRREDRITRRKLQFNTGVFVLIKTGVIIDNGADYIFVPRSIRVIEQHVG